MSTIHVLDPKTAAKIAAGEVVEKPASVVKELVENALDAGARQISGEVRDGGTSFIRITDDGSGIAPEDVETAFGRHATSKLSSVEDLSTVTTLGFRGEALPSIAAVGEVELVTCIKGGSSGDAVTFENGSLTGHVSMARPQGTTVTVKNLFRNVPARLKFLKSNATENSRIADIVSQYALAFPEVKFSLIIDARTVLQTPGSNRLLDSLIALYGVETASKMIAVNRTDAVWKEGLVNEINVEGMVSLPTLTRGNRNDLHFFVNRRSINSRLLAWAVEEAYQTLIMVGRHPIAVINIKIPPAEVDVNVHPTKSEVKFRDERAVGLAVQRAVKAALAGISTIPKIEDVGSGYKGTRQSSSNPMQLWDEMHKATIPPQEPSESQPPQTGKAALPALRILGQVDRNYIVAEGPDGVYIIDQHAAHERILYEKIKEQMAQRAVEVQGLLTPVTFQVAPQQDETLKSRLDEFAALGFGIEAFGERTYLIRAMPSILAADDCQAAIQELLNEPTDRGADRLDTMAKSLACHGVVRAGKVLSDEEMKALVRQLEQAAMPYTCPHGRPTLIHLTVSQMEKEFGRT